MKQWLVALLLLSTLPLTHSYASQATDQPPQPSFIVSLQPERQPKSTRGIKEAMGDSLENIIRQCASLQQELAQLHIHLSSIQTHALSSVRNLIDNTGPTKSSKKEELREGLSVLQSTEHQLNAQLQTTKALSQKLSISKEKPGEVLKKASSTVKEQCSFITKIHHDLTTTKSFKRS